MVASPKLGAIADALLYYLYLNAKISDGRHSFNEIKSWFNNHVSLRQIQLAVEELRDRDCCLRVGSGDTLKIRISREGYLVVEKDLESEESIAYGIAKDGNEWLFSADGAIAPQQAIDEIPAANRTVTLDHNSAEYTDATTKLDDLIEAVGQDRTNDFNQKNQLLAELKAGKELLKSPFVSPEKVEFILYGCFAYLATKFADEPIGALAHLVWTAIKTLLGH